MEHKSDEESVRVSALLRSLADKLDQREVELIGCWWKDATTLLLSIVPIDEKKSTGGSPPISQRRINA